MPASEPHLAAAQRPQGLILAALLVGALAVVALRLWVGTAGVGWPKSDEPRLRAELARATDARQQQRLLAAIDDARQGVRAIMVDRAFRLAQGVIVGVSLAAAGVALQALLRNPLAEPFILGLSSGAGVGIMVQWLLFQWWRVNAGSSHLGALLGAGANIVIVYLASRRRGMLDPLGLLLTGVVLSTINGAAIMVLNYGAPGWVRNNVALWMMGYLHGNVSVGTLETVGAVMLVGVGLLLWQGRAMDVATFSDAEAQSLGVNLRALRGLLFAVSSVLAAGAVVLAGPVAFVGLICPHLARLMLGPSHRPLLLASALLGAMLILLADMAACLLAQGLSLGLMPLGIFTALIGGPVFLWLLHPTLGRGTE